jgi:hypothetical protein
LPTLASDDAQPAKKPHRRSCLGGLEQSVIDRLDAFIRSNRELNWTVVRRGFWVHGVDGLA